MKRNSKKLAFLTAAICVVLCGALILGGTYAWFNDKVTNGENVIAAGTLDVKFEYSDKAGQTWKDASEGAIFDYANWEPGYTMVRKVKISNIGSLAFRYTLILNTDEVATEQGVKLSDVIDVYMGSGDLVVNDRSVLASMTYVGTLADLIADPDGAARGALEGKKQNEEAKTDSVTIALKMKETAGNEYQGLSIGTETNGIALQLIAEQNTVESDDFGSNYDISSNLPIAKVTYLDVQEQEMFIENNIKNGISFNDGEIILIKPEKAFTFKAQDDATTIENSPYKDWRVDYYVSVDKPVEEGVILIGNYEAFSSSWFGFRVPAGEYTDAVPLLGTVAGGLSDWTYADIVGGVETFNCGVYNNNVNNEGKIMTVELRVVNPNNEDEYHVIESVKYTFE